MPFQAVFASFRKTEAIEPDSNRRQREMKAETLYIIRPRLEMLRAVFDREPEWVSLFVETTVWRRRESMPRTSHAAEWPVLREAQVKLLFLLDLVDQYDLTTSAPDEFQRYVGTLVGLPELDVGHFDHFWTIERTDDHDSFERVQERISKYRPLSDLVSPNTDPLLLDWLLDE